MQHESSVELTLLGDGQWSMASGAASRANPFEAAPPPALAQGVAPSLPGPDEAPAAPPSNEPPQAAPPRLSLDQLGVGTNPFMDRSVEPLTKAEQANSRLQAALHPPSLERDRQRGLGAAGPVADAARRLVLADDGLAETSAVLNVRVDSTGHVTEVHVLESSSQAKAWQWIAARLAQALNRATLRTASSKRGWDMKLRLASSVQLPSGAAPGMRMGVLGQQVAASGGPAPRASSYHPPRSSISRSPSTASNATRTIRFNSKSCFSN